MFETTMRLLLSLCLDYAKLTTNNNNNKRNLNSNYIQKNGMWLNLTNLSRIEWITCWCLLSNWPLNEIIITKIGPKYLLQVLVIIARWVSYYSFQEKIDSNLKANTKFSFNFSFKIITILAHITRCWLKFLNCENRERFPTKLHYFILLSL